MTKRRQRRRGRQETQAPLAQTNRASGNDTYRLRRKVINLVYSARDLARSCGVELPRVTVRVTTRDEGERNLLGAARLANDIIWITEDAIQLPAEDLRAVVYHEIVHAVCGIRHVEGCPLMGSTLVEGQSNRVLDKLFMGYIKRALDE